ncbi:hypothetical protein [Wolbachia endosymbiont of Drosophila pseudotakahashii]|uniref:hypothetical protein n=1 Tax=Wolbachia endosymbiont of Drosophila pseudotakahashii TaxID=375919 RepID=UPI0022307DC4|nr:hypothetical protein [Wolbachia endosymbiont of Drosophila pseudotakahashii]MCX3065409.1 hypothetical protein [Wolbachia endosymbiont of Drosophila pseudotakahashii]UZE38620.1 hypothetical protein ONI09_00400 [Wolbachia endosymbiont of Drosophila pseudotakahashii]
MTAETVSGIQESLLVSKQTSIESGYNIFDEIIWKTRSQWALLHRSSEKNWQLLTKFIINSHLTVEEKICHKK